MLHPAQLYEDNLREKFISVWYNPKYQWYFDEERYILNLPKDTQYRRDFVHLDKNGEVDGYFAYAYTELSKSMHNFGLVSFTDKYNHAFIKDILNHIFDMIKKGLVQRIELWAYADNPACKGYEKFCSRYGGQKLCTLHRSAFFNGRYHNTNIYEFLFENMPENLIKETQQRTDTDELIRK